MDAEKGSVARWGLHCLLRLDRIESGEVLMKEETKMRTTAQVLVDCLEAEGVDVIFGIPGEGDTGPDVRHPGQQNSFYSGAS